MKNKKNRKRVTAAVAVGLVVALALTGTYAWQSISQQQVNKKMVVANPGGRLHDEWNGDTKQIYVENFSKWMAEDDGTGSNTNKTVEDPDAAPIFVRVRLKEFLEFGNDAGDLTVDAGTQDLTKTDRKPLVTGTEANKRSGWHVHVKDDNTDPFHKYFTWTTGESATFTYMPTFNRNKDSLAADINGTYRNGNDYSDADVAGKSNKTYESSYKNILVNGVATDLTGGGTGAFKDYINWGTTTTLTADEIYDADSNDVDEGTTSVDGTNHESVKSATHNAVTTTAADATDKVYKMADWKANGSPIGKYWVWDTDGWVYWAEPLQPGEVTGLLLSKVTSNNNLDDKCYYAIDVTMQCASAGDWGEKGTSGGSDSYAKADGATGFYINEEDSSTKGITDDAIALLNKIIEIQYNNSSN